MTSDNIDDPVKILHIAAMKRNWEEVSRLFEGKRELRTEKIAPTGNTVLHMAVYLGELDAVQRMVGIFKDGEGMAAAEENGDEKKRVLGAKNEKGNTPLHLAASAWKWSVEMCVVLGKDDPSLITIPNENGETPLFMAALYGNKEAFLWLHYHSPDQGSSIHYRNRDYDTILHCAIAGGHIDLAIEIVLLYKDRLEEMTMMRNKNGLRPLHLLAATPSAFESTDLSGRSFLVQLLYHWFFRVKKKEQATTIEELEPHEREPFIETLKNWRRLKHYVKFYDCCEKICHPVFIIIYVVFAYLIWFLSLFLLAPLFVLEYLFLRAENWFRGVRKLKEKHTWSLQIMERLFELPSGVEDVTADPYIGASEAADSTIVETPLMIAAQNGMKEMVVKILELFPSAMEVVNEEGKNIVLVAVEKRQTHLYRVLCEDLAYSAFRQVDKDGNTALHLAAMPWRNLNVAPATMIEEFKWFDFVKSSVPCELGEKYNNDGKTADEIFYECHKDLDKSDRQWLNQTSQAWPVASTVVASMAFSNFAGENSNKKNYPSLVALSLSLTSTICLLAVLSFRSLGPRNFWKYVPSILHLAILTIFCSIVALWVSLMVHGKSLTTYAIIGLPIAIITLFFLPVVIVQLMSVFAKVPPPNRRTISAIRYRRPQIKKDETDFDRNIKSTPNYASGANDSLQDIGSSRGRARIKRRHNF